MRRSTIRTVIDAILGGRDTDSVTRRIRLSLARRQSPASNERGIINDLANLVSGRSSAQNTIRHLSLRRTRS